MKTGYKGVTILKQAAYHAPYRPAPDTWQSYLSRLGNGLNGIYGAGSSTTVTEADILARAEKYMKTRYPGPYCVEPYYNANKMKWDLRLRFDDPKQETIWLLRWSQ
jgi:hypothetical protein